MQDKFKGLSDSQVLDSREKYGENVIHEPEPPTLWDRIKEGFEDPMIRLLCGIAALMIVLWITGHGVWYEPVGIIFAVMLVTFISAKTSLAADSAYRKLKESTKSESVKVIRNGAPQEIDISQVVVGDIVILQSGDRIPADGILVDGKLRVDNSALNGEAEECKKIAAPNGFEMPDQITGDTFVDKHSLFKGATVYNGEGYMLVKRVGTETMMGRMAEDMHAEEVKSPLQVKLSNLAQRISVFGYVGAIVISIARMVHFIALAGGLSQYLTIGGLEIFKDVISALTTAITIVVCAVPEGLPLMIAIVLMQNSGKMLAHNVLVRKAIGIETAGSMNILFSDKTGTITKGKLEVVEFYAGNGKISDNSEQIQRMMHMAIGKNTTAVFDEKGHVLGGNATDQALMNYIGKDVFNKLQGDSTLTVTDLQSFNSTNKFSQAYIDSLGLTMYKGAPERILTKAKRYLDTDGSVKPVDLNAVNDAIDGLADKAMRVIAFAYSPSKMTMDSINEDAILIGFVGIRDDVRPEARDAIKEVQNAGIQVVMITGDRKETAVAIAKDAGLITSGDHLALTSEELNALPDDQVKELLPNLRVIARALPTDKSRMVRLCQELNLVTGMTGDGVNDSPALKRADVGFAMGSGTAVAKEAGDIVILDDNFKSICSAILFGRTIYINILKFCKFQLVINVAAVLVSAIAPFVGVEDPLKVTHLLWVNLVMDTLGALALGNEPALREYMNHKPRRRDESLVSKKMFAQILTMGGYLTVISLTFLLSPFFAGLFQNPAQHLTAYFCLFILAAVVNGFNVRSDTWNVFQGAKENPKFFKVMGLIAGIQVLLSFVGGDIFSCTPFGIAGWCAVILLALSMYPVDVIRKMITR